VARIVLAGADGLEGVTLLHGQTFARLQCLGAEFEDLGCLRAVGLLVVDDVVNYQTRGVRSFIDDDAFEDQFTAQ